MLLVLLHPAQCCLHSVWSEIYCDCHEPDELHKACYQAREALLCRSDASLALGVNKLYAIVHSSLPVYRILMGA